MSSDSATMCWQNSSPHLALALGDDCVLGVRWFPDPAKHAPKDSGNGVVVADQVCSMTLDGNPTTFYVRRGSFRHTGTGQGGILDGEIAGDTLDGDAISLRYTGSGASTVSEAKCDALVDHKPQHGGS